MAQRIPIAVHGPVSDRVAALVAILTAAGRFEVVVVADAADLPTVVADVVLIDLPDPSQDSLARFARLAGAQDRALVVTVEQTAEGLAQFSVEAGLSAFVVGKLSVAPLLSAIDCALARFRLLHGLRRDLEASRRALGDRKLIDRAKGILMRARGLSEDDAYALLRRTAMDQSRKVADVAQALVTAADLLA